MPRGIPMKSEKPAEVSKLPEPEKESPRAKFKRIGGNRMYIVMKYIGLLGNLHNRSIYAYDEGDVNKMIGAINEATADLALRLRDRKAQARFSFDD